MPAAISAKILAHAVAQAEFDGLSELRLSYLIRNKENLPIRELYLQQNVTIVIPPKLYLTKKVARNRILQLNCPEAAQPGEMVRTAAESGSLIHMWGKKVSVSTRAPAHLPAGVDDALVLSGDRLSWAKRIETRNPKWAEIVNRRDAAISGLRQKFKFIEEEQGSDRTVKTPGLRPPQIGAIYSALGHLRMTSEVGTIVLPTWNG